MERSNATKPNVVYVFPDRWRACATGYNGDPNLAGKTPRIDAFAGESVDFSLAVSSPSMCCPYRAALMTGQYPLTHGVLVNDVPIKGNPVTLAQAFSQEGYGTAFIGKWHSAGHVFQYPDDGMGGARTRYVEPEDRLRFEYWMGSECAHGQGLYYWQTDRTPRHHDGYLPDLETKEAITYIRENALDGKPFALFVAYDPPHPPHIAPDKYKQLFTQEDIVLRPNVDPADAEKARAELHGYYSHMAALDDLFGTILDAIDAAGIRDDTIVVFTSDHGDSTFSHESRSACRRAWDENIRPPFLLRYPRLHGDTPSRIDAPIHCADIMPTLLGLCDIAIPETVEGDDFSDVARGERVLEDNPVLLTEIMNHTEGGLDLRGVRTRRNTYVRSLKGPWLLFDNENDPYQMDNLVNKPEHAKLQAEMEQILKGLLAKRNDGFQPGETYMAAYPYGDLPFMKGYCSNGRG